MNKFIIVFAFVALLKPVIPLVEYMVNYDYISKVLCENKAKPELKCNGKCHLMKEMAKASEDEKPLQNDKKSVHIESEVLFFQEIELLQIPLIIFKNNNKISDNYTNSYSHLSSFSVFHPPTILS